MARSVRMDYPDTFYHVLSRGNERRAIFRDKQDYEKFIDLISRMVERFDLDVHAYVLMNNHYHLLLRTRLGNLSKAIQWLGLSYSIWFNRKHKRAGHLFQGRFKSFVIENERYFVAMCLYIHRNPVRAGIVNNPLDYPWSSYPSYMRVKKKGDWLTTSLILGMFSNKKQFVKEQLAYAGKEQNLFDDLRYGLFLGSEQFVEKWRAQLQKEQHLEKPQVKMALQEQDIRQITERIFTKLGVKDPSLYLKHLRGKRRPYRDLAIYILCHLGIFAHQDIGRVFGVGYTSISGASKRAQVYLDSNKKMKKKVESILNDK